MKLYMSHCTMNHHLHYSNKNIYIVYNINITLNCKYKYTEWVQWEIERVVKKRIRTSLTSKWINWYFPSNDHKIIYLSNSCNIWQRWYWNGHWVYYEKRIWLEKALPLIETQNTILNYSSQLKSIIKSLFLNSNLIQRKFN